MITDEERQRLSRVIAVSIVKGGQGKTTLTANLAAQLARHSRVLVIDFDPQRNLRNNLGYVGTGVDDRGAELLSAMSEPRPLEPFKGIRSNLDVIPGGPRLIELQERLILAKAQNQPAAEQLAHVLAPIAENYDYVLIDCPPDMGIMQQTALAAASYVVVPMTKGDANALDGVESLADALHEVREINPYLRLLGVVAFGFRPQAKSSLASATAATAEILDSEDFMFTSVIRDAPSVPLLEQDRGLTVHELAAEFDKQEPWWKPLRTGERTRRRLPDVLPGLASDFSNLEAELLQRIAANEGTVAK